MFQTKIAEKIKTHILCLVTFFFENRVFSKITGNIIVEWGRPQKTLRRMCIVPWLTEATDTSSVIIAFPLQQWLHESTPTLGYTYIFLSCF